MKQITNITEQKALTVLFTGLFALLVYSVASLIYSL